MDFQSFDWPTGCGYQPSYHVLVILGCYDSGRRQIRAERPGTRSILAALWAKKDRATEQFMSRFHGHLVRGETTSDSLHQVIKWIRGNDFARVCEWVPYLLIGVNVTFD